MKRRLLRLLRLTERPDPPPGSGPTLVVFRASPRLFRFRAAGWALRQGFAFLGIFLSLALLAALEQAGEPEGWLGEWMERGMPTEVYEVQHKLFDMWGGLVTGFSIFLHVLEWGAIALFAINLWVSWSLLRLDWEARWYMVSDESLRIREGLLRTHERTMTVANIQNLKIRRGPVQKLLGVADLEVHTAGGGPVSASQQASGHDNLHVGRFRGIDDAEALRDRIQAAMLRHRGSGLGDPDDHHDEPARGGGARGALAVACEELLHEARGLRVVVEGRERAAGGGAPAH